MIHSFIDHNPPSLDDERNNPSENSNNTTRNTHARSRSLKRHTRATRLHPTGRSSHRTSISGSASVTARGSSDHGRSSHGAIGDSPSLQEPVAQTGAAASVESTLRVVLASGVEVAARADGESGGAVAVCAVLALPVI